MHMCAGCWVGKAGLAAPEARTIAAVHVAKKKASEVQRVGMCIMTYTGDGGTRGVQFRIGFYGKKAGPKLPVRTRYR